MTARRTSPPGPLPASRRGGTVALVAMLACCVAGPARAQDSQFGIKGLGTPGRMEGVRVRSTAGAFPPFDPISALAGPPPTWLGPPPGRAPPPPPHLPTGPFAPRPPARPTP